MHWLAGRCWRRFSRFRARCVNLLFRFWSGFTKRTGTGKITIVGISQNAKKDTAGFIKEYGVTFPVLLDDTESYPASNAYGLTNVPSLFWIAPDGAD